MKATGIVRRVDDLGRVVIPREVRKTCNIREGDPLEIFIEDGSVIFKPYLPYLEPWRLVENVAEAVEASDDYSFTKFLPQLRSLAREMEKSARR